jgi:hypothetical protein
MEAPWEIHQKWIEENNLIENHEFIVSYFIQYRDWLFDFLDKHFPTVLSLQEIVNFSILFNLFQYITAQEGDPDLQHIRINVIIRGLLPMSETMGTKLFLQYVSTQYPDVPPGTLLFFYQLYKTHPRRLPRTITDRTFKMILYRVSIPELVAFAQTIFMGHNSYQLIPQHITETAVQSGIFELPVPGYDLMHYAVRGEPGHFFSEHLEAG